MTLFIMYSHLKHFSNHHRFLKMRMKKGEPLKLLLSLQDYLYLRSSRNQRLENQKKYKYETQKGIINYQHLRQFANVMTF